MFLMLLSLSIYKGMDMVPLCFKLFQEMLGCFPKQLHHFISHPQCTECSLSLAPRGLRGCWGRGNHLGTRRSLGAFGCWEQVPAQLGEGRTTEGTRGFIMILIHISLMISDVDHLFM